MTKELFEEWLIRLNKKMKDENKKILLILDNATVHSTIRDFKNIKLLYLHKNTTSRTQPLDISIIKAFKDNYKKLVSRKLLFEDENCDNNYEKSKGKINILNC